MKTVIINLYKFNELSESAQEKAIGDCRFINVEHDWWDAIYDDAENIFAKIRGFDIGRKNYCDMFLTLTMEDTINAILSNHGETCETYEIAKRYRYDWKIAKRNLKQEEWEDEDDLIYRQEKVLDVLAEEFISELGEEYLSMLRREYEYLTSDEAIREYLVENDLDFRVDGSIY